MARRSSAARGSPRGGGGTGSSTGARRRKSRPTLPPEGTEAHPSGLPILWSPWRLEYVLKGRPPGCIACEALAGGVNAETLVLHRSARSFVMLNRFPYNVGHLMICPVRHLVDPSEMDDAEMLDAMRLLARCGDLLRASMKAGGINAGLNLGAASGGSVDHLHLHVVPRWVGDANFISVIGKTKTLLETLDGTWHRLRKEMATW